METYRFKLFTSLMSKINKSIRKIKAMEMAEFNLKSTHVWSDIVKVDNV